MPTGYTVEIPNGISFEKFAMTCAGATLRSIRRPLLAGCDTSGVFQPDMYHFHEMIHAVRRLEELQAMSDEEAEAAATKEWEERETRRIKRLQECIDARAAYSAMLAKVDNWVPTEQHRELKRFMRQQIETSVEADCLEEFYRDVTLA